MRRDVASTAFRIATPMAATARIKTLNHTSSWFEKTGGPDGAAIAPAFMGWRCGAAKNGGARPEEGPVRAAVGRCCCHGVVAASLGRCGTRNGPCQPAIGRPTRHSRRSAASRERRASHSTSSTRQTSGKTPRRGRCISGRAQADVTQKTKRLVVDSVVKQTRSKHRTGGGDAYSSHLSPFAWSMT